MLFEGDFNTARSPFNTARTPFNTARWIVGSLARPLTRPVRTPFNADRSTDDNEQRIKTEFCQVLLFFPELFVSHRSLVFFTYEIVMCLQNLRCPNLPALVFFA